MKLRLKEQPREWQKFALVLVVIVSLGAFYFWHRHRISPQIFGSIWIAVGLIAVVVSIWPRVFRMPYRIAMTASYYLGQAVGQVLLALLFMLLVTPLGILLRCLGKDLLQLRREPQNRTYWRTPKHPGSFDRLF